MPAPADAATIEAAQIADGAPSDNRPAAITGDAERMNAGRWFEYQGGISIGLFVGPLGDARLTQPMAHARVSLLCVACNVGLQQTPCPHSTQSTSSPCYLCRISSASALRVRFTIRSNPRQLLLFIIASFTVSNQCVAYAFLMDAIAWTRVAFFRNSYNPTFAIGPSSNAFQTGCYLDLS